MPIQTWSGLQKSATDPETIEEAIARLIAVHEADPESHLGEGESLQAHKNADVIDHPANSVVTDKIPDDSIPNSKLHNTRYIVHNDFESVAGFDYSCTFFSNIGYAEMGTDTTADTWYNLAIFGDQNNNWNADRNKNPSIEFMSKLANSSNVVAYVGFMGEPEDSGVHFKFSGGNIYYTWVDNDIVEHSTLISGVSGTTRYRFKIYIEYGVGVHWYIDEVEVGFVSWATWDTGNGSGGSLFFAWIKKTTSTNKNLDFNYLTYQQDY